jgi:alpha-D-ribose 1-methylphosphonate 5-triphosphate synthase subunit PhnG
MQQEFDTAERQTWLGLLARAPLETLERWAAGGVPGHTWLRRPETGLVMVRGRAGGKGEQFNLGEMTLTRCALRLASGEAGIAYIQGRSARKAELAALADGMLQSPQCAASVKQGLIEPVRAALAAQQRKHQSHAQATRVDFFTLVRGAD